MKIWRPKKLLPPAATAVMFVAAMALLLFGSVEGTRAALTYYSETYASRVQMYDIGVSLLENGERPTGPGMRIPASFWRTCWRRGSP